MANILVVFYSRSGNTRKVAEHLANLVQADIEEIESVTSYRGPVGFLKGGFASSTKKQPLIVVGKKTSKYDQVILLSPIWAGTVAAPVRTWLVRQRGEIKELTLVTTSGGSTGEGIVSSMKNEFDINVKNYLFVTSKEIADGSYEEKLKGIIL